MPQAAGDTPATVMRDEAERHQPQPVPPPPTPSRSRIWGARILGAVARRLSRLAGLVLLLIAVYAGLRLFGDNSVQRGLDVAERRAQAAIAQAWRRLTED